MTIAAPETKRRALGKGLDSYCRASNPRAPRSAGQETEAESRARSPWN